METVVDFILGGFKITAVGDSSHEIKRYLLLGRKVMTNLDSLFGEGNGTPLQYSCLESPMDGGAWWAAVRGVARSRTRLRDFTFTFHIPALDKEMATHSSVLALRIPGTGEPGGLPSMGSHRVRHDWSDSAAAAADSLLKSRDTTNKRRSSQSYGFSSNHVWMLDLDYKESWMQKNWCFWTVVLEEILESPLDCKKIEPVHPKGNQSWIFTGRTDAEAETPIFGHLMRRTDSFEKTLMLGKIEGRRIRGW